MLSPYDDSVAADVYARVTAPAQFAAPARDLVERLKLTANMTVVDVGAGTGTIAEAIIGARADHPRLFGIDASLEMLRVGREARWYPVVAGRLPDLPFRTESFDVVTAGFVIPHVANFGDALIEVRRVCRRSGRFGMTVWGSSPNAAGQIWMEVASQFVSRRDLDEAFRAHVPWDAWFSDVGNLKQALTDAQFAAVRVHTHMYRVRMSVEDFMASRQASVQGEILRERLSAGQWSAFFNQLEQALRQRFSAVVDYERDVHFGIAMKS